MNTQKIEELLQRNAELERELATKTWELQIESALERIRNRTLLMKDSNELSDTAVILFQQFRELGLLPAGAQTYFNVIDDEDHTGNVWITQPGGRKALQGFRMSMNHFPPLIKVYEGWKRKESIIVRDLSGDDLNEYFRILKSIRTVNENESYQQLFTSAPQRRIIYDATFQQGTLGIATNTPVSQDALDTLMRFAKVFEFTYTRFLDLKQAEAQTKEAQIEASLERVRSRTMAMQKSEELTAVAELLFREVNDLGIKTWTTGFNVWSDDNNFYTDYITNPQGGFIEPYTIDSREFHVFSAMSEAKKRGDEFYLHFEEGDLLAETYRQLGKFGGKQFQAILDSGFQFPTKQYEHFIFGSRVSLMFITYEPVPDAHEIFKRFGKVFEQTYTRFLDLQKAEAQAVQAEQDLIEIKAARKRAEDTLAALKAAQRQLIQREKMASLGELTAGIAHEIQNPLNFVNNFSEANTELLEELELEANKGNLDEVQQLAHNIRQNEQKIIYHGKRADNIVKGMLHHARASTGKKESININQLAEEYLRLSYQGLRAKDKSFNTTIQTNFDENIGYIQVVPQEIGHVLLNLYNNAFYAVSEKKRQLDGNYEPAVYVRVQKDGNAVVISVKDNGTGMPAKIAEKVFQPFFTTKPSGEGTGLGLSLSYDIITKGHGGTLSVTSKEGEGAEFVVELPAS